MSMVPGEFKANMEWCHKNWLNYHKLWVALYNGNLVVCGPEESDLAKMVTTHPHKDSILCIQIGRDYQSL